MTPQQYIDSLKKQNNSKPEFSNDKLLKLFKNDQDKAFLEKIGGISNFDFGEYLLYNLRPRLSESTNELIDSGIIAIGEIINPIPNIYVKKIANNKGYAIIFHSGLRDFIYRVTRAYSTQTATHEEHQSNDLMNLLNHEEFTRIIAEIFWWFQESQNSFGPSKYPISNQQKLFAGKLTSEVESFLVAHEIGHIIQDIARIEDYNEIPGGTIAHSEEYMADLVGFNIIMDFDNGKDNLFEYQMSYLGIEFVFQIYRALEYIGLEFGNTHPKSENRIKFMRERLKSILSPTDYDVISSLSVGAELIFDRVLEVLKNPKEYEEYYFHKAQQLENELESLFNEYAKKVPLDYYKFNKKVFKILDEGYPTSILSKMMKIRDDFIEEMKISDLNKNKLDNEDLFLLNKFKLIMGLIQDMSQPAKSIYSKEI